MSQRQVVLVYNARRAEAVRTAERAALWLQENGIATLWLDQVAVAALTAPPEGTELVLTLGGDGTLLMGARLAAPAGVPVLGVHVGHFGFIAQVRPEQMEDALTQWLRGESQIQERLMVQARVGAEEKSIYGLNEVALCRASMAPMLTFRIEINGLPLTSYPADGSLVATPTGSTAYALSAGAPVLHPSAQALLLVPISPHTLGARPLVLPPDARITITLEPDREEGIEVGTKREALLTTDGNYYCSLQPGESVHITQAPFRTRLLAFREGDFFEKLRSRLLWGARVND